MMAVTLIVETGAIVAGANTYVSLADAELYMEARLDVAIWDAATDDLKNRSLAQATRTIDSRTTWKGYEVSPNIQTLDWPRSDVQNGVDVFASDDVPSDVADATCELALFLLSGDRTTDSASSGLNSIVLGKGAVEIEFNNSTEADILPDTVHSLLSRWSTSTGGARRQITVIRG